jgi:hypothetical protein
MAPDIRGFELFDSLVREIQELSWSGLDLLGLLDSIHDLRGELDSGKLLGIGHEHRDEPTNHAHRPHKACLSYLVIFLFRLRSEGANEYDNAPPRSGQ